MNLTLQHKNLEVSSELRKIIEKGSRKTRKVLPTFSSRDLQLHIKLERFPRKHQYRAVLVLTTPQKALRVEDTEDNPKASLLRCFHELLRKVERFKSNLNRERMWHRQIVTSPLGPSSNEENELKETLIDNLDTLENYARRELSHHAITESLPADRLDPQALIDEVVLEALSIEDILPDERGENPEERIAAEESQKRLRKAIARLPRPIRETFILFALEGFNSDEVAMITGKTPAEVTGDVEKARQELRRRLQ